MNEFTIALHGKMKAVIKLIYETDALQAWAYEDGDGEPSIASLLRESYKMLEADDGEIAPLMERIEKAESLLHDIESVFYTDMLHQGEWEEAIHELLRENGYKGPGG